MDSGQLLGGELGTAGLAALIGGQAIARRALDELEHPRGELGLELSGLAPVDPPLLCDEIARRDQLVDQLPVGGRAQQLVERAEQRLHRQARAAAALGLGEHVQGGGATALRAIVCDAESACDPVRGDEAHPEHARQLVGALTDHAGGGVAVRVVKPRPQVGEPMRSEHQMQLAGDAALAEPDDRSSSFSGDSVMVKTLIAIAVAGAFALPLAVQASGSNNIVLAQGGGGGGDTGASTRQPGATPPGQVSPGTPRSAATGADRETGADRNANPSGSMDRDRASGGEHSASGRSASRDFERLDKNHDGYISRDEAKDASELNTRFTELDRNNDGKLSRDEYSALNESSRGATGTTGTGRSGTSSSGSMGSSSSSAPTGKGPGSQESASRPMGGGDGGSGSK